MIQEAITRVKKPTPKFFKRLRRILLVAGAVGGVLATAPISLPTLLVTAGGYLALAGAVGGAISSLPKEDE